MYICSCHAVTDGQIKRAVNEEGVCTWRQLREKTKVSTQCGTCGKCALALFRQLQAAKEQAAREEAAKDGTDDSNPPVQS